MRSFLHLEHPILFEQLDNEKNTDIDLENLTSGSHQLAWWKCPTCQTSWQAKVYTRSQGFGKCPECHRKKSLAETYPTLMKQWDFSKNNIDPEKVYKSSKEVVNWRCRKCNYSWKDSIISRTTKENPNLYPECPSCGE